MARFITTKGITSELSDIIGRTNQRLILITPYVKIAGYFEEKLHAASKRGVTIIVVCREETLHEDQKKLLLAIPSLQLYTHSNVHSKCYYNEERLVLGSMNFYEYSDQNNREMGVVVERATDSNLYDDAIRECEEILQMAKRTGKSFPHKSNSPKTQPYVTKVQPHFLERIARVFLHEGFCVRCKVELDLNPNYPFCSSCYKTWAVWGNADFEEKYCHCCGKNEMTTMRKPVCLDCYRTHSF